MIKPIISKTEYFCIIDSLEDKLHILKERRSGTVFSEDEIANEENVINSAILQFKKAYKKSNNRKSQLIKFISNFF